MLFEKINEDIKDAMKSKNDIKRNCLRSIVSEIKNQTVNAGKPITDEICIKVVQKSVKQHNDSIEQFTKANRIDLSENEKSELAYISVYLPRMMSESETEALIKNVMAEMAFSPEKKNMGQIMKILKTNKEVDGKTASIILNRILK